MTGTKTILGFIAGVSIGAIAGILLSPGKGSDTRQKIIDKTIDTGNSLKDWATNLVKSKKSVGNPQPQEYTAPKMNLNTMG